MLITLDSGVLSFFRPDSETKIREPQKRNPSTESKLKVHRIMASVPRGNHPALPRLFPADFRDPRFRGMRSPRRVHRPEGKTGRVESGKLRVENGKRNLVVIAPGVKITFQLIFCEKLGGFIGTARNTGDFL